MPKLQQPSSAAVAPRLRSALPDAPIFLASDGDSCDAGVLSTSAVLLNPQVTPRRSPSPGTREADRRINIAQLQVLQHLVRDRGMAPPFTVEEALNSAAAWCLSSLNVAAELGQVKVSLASFQAELKAGKGSVMALRE